MSNTDSISTPLPPKKRSKKHSTAPPPLPQSTLTSLPATSTYSKSYMHRSPVTSLLSSSKLGMIITTSSEDGVLKFWKRTGDDASIEFVKSFVCHVGGIASTSISSDGLTGVTVGKRDGVIKVFDVTTFDISGMIKTDNACKGDKEKSFFGLASCFVTKAQTCIAVSLFTSSAIHIYSLITLSNLPVKIITVHVSPVTSLVYHSESQVVISTDTSGIIEYWSSSTSNPSDIGIPHNTNDGYVKWESKFDTDLYALASKTIVPVSACVSRENFAVLGSDAVVRVFNFATGKVVRSFDDSIGYYQKQHGDNALSSSSFSSKENKENQFDSIELGKRLALESELLDSPLYKTQLNSTLLDNTGSESQSLTISFDATGRLLLYPCLIGIKVVDILSGEVVRVIGSRDASFIRFTSFVVGDVNPKVDKQISLAREGGMKGTAIDHSDKGKTDKLDPCVFCAGFKGRRVFVFNKGSGVLKSKDADQEDEDDEDSVINQNRDVYNEPPTVEEIRAAQSQSSKPQNPLTSKDNVLGNEAILRTSLGDIHFKLFKETPLTNENFCTLAKRGYYDNVIFHRVIKGFMLQTGDPLGDGTGGSSCWGGEFKDEIVKSLKHDRGYTVSMANSGPHTNGSQFFITTGQACGWLDGKHSVFGRVSKGADVVDLVEKGKTDESDRPLDEVKILGVEIV